MLETIREYAAQRLDDATKRAATPSHYRALAEHADRALRERRPDRLARATRHRAREPARRARPRSGDVRLAGALAAFWNVRGHAAEGLQRITTALDARGGGARACESARRRIRPRLGARRPRPFAGSRRAGARALPRARRLDRHGQGAREPRLQPARRPGPRPRALRGGAGGRGDGRVTVSSRSTAWAISRCAPASSTAPATSPNGRWRGGRRRELGVAAFNLGYIALLDGRREDAASHLRTRRADVRRARRPGDRRARARRAGDLHRRPGACRAAHRCGRRAPRSRRRRRVLRGRAPVERPTPALVRARKHWPKGQSSRSTT